MTGSDSPGVRIPPPLLFATAVAAGVLIDGNVADWAHVTEPLQLAGVSFALSGLALIAISLGLFRRFRTRPELWQPSSALITSGLDCRSRRHHIHDHERRNIAAAGCRQHRLRPIGYHRI